MEENDKNALAILRRVLTLVPDKIKQALSRRPGPFGDGIVYYEEADGTPCYGRIQGNILFKLWTDESGFYTEIEEIDISNWDRDARFWWGMFPSGTILTSSH